ncbi:MAG: histidine phosphatase family protein [Candidatus Binatus sp.]
MKSIRVEQANGPFKLVDEKIVEPARRQGAGVRHLSQRRVRVLDTIASRHSAGTVIVASHGNLVALALHAIMPNVDYAFWESIPMPAVFTLVREDKGWRCTNKRT